jgi:L-lactate dehydrogenase (cytochrome)
MTAITHIADLQALAKKRVPKMFYDYADSGSWTESTYQANEDDFQKIKLRQRVAVNMEGRSTASHACSDSAHRHDWHAACRW